ncbi:hypothetical protein D3C86_1371720 [compost metagenome]
MKFQEKVTKEKSEERFIKLVLQVLRARNRRIWKRLFTLKKMRLSLGNSLSKMNIETTFLNFSKI